MILTCPICKSTEISQFWNQVWMDASCVVKRCDHCELFFLHPPKKPQAQAAFDENYERYIAKREELIAQHSDDSFADMVDDSIQARYQDIQAYFEGASSVLEVGAEKGGFLDLLKNKVPTLCGVDACPEYRDLLKAKGYHAALYVEELSAVQKFDRVCFFSLLEHILEPLPFLERLKNHLSPEGVMVMEVPSADEPLIKLYDIDAFKSFYFQGMHPYVYSLKSLTLLFSECGLAIDKVQYKQRYGLDNHLQWLKEGIPGGSKKFEHFFSSSFQNSYKTYLEQRKTTDTLYLTVRAATSSS
ncbi:class I SAM-dependent methyltransferase [Deltaproteobacteria bacterium TL4]